MDRNKIVVLIHCSSKVSLKVDNSQCTSHCISTSTAAQFVSQSLHEGKFQPVAPIKSVKGMDSINNTICRLIIHRAHQMCRLKTYLF